MRSLIGLTACLALAVLGAEAHETKSDNLANTARLLQNSRQNRLDLNVKNDANGYVDYLTSNVKAQTLADVTSLARETLGNGLSALSNSSYDVSPTCLNDTVLLLQGLVNTELWALKMIDAMGKPPSGLLEFKLIWLGSYHECVNTQAVVYGDPVNKTDPLSYPYKGRYCKAAFPIGAAKPSLSSPTGLALTIGLCVPNSCNSHDVTALLNTGIYALPINTSSISEPIVTCQLESLEFDSKAIATIVVCLILAFIILLATAYDVLIIQYHVADVVKDFTSRAAHYSNDISSGEEGEERANGYGSIPYSGATEARVTSKDRHILSNGTDEERRHIGNISNTNDLHKGKDIHEVTTHQPGRLGKALLAFSVYTNASKILNTNQPAGTLSAVNGIRFLSMSWVILGHTYAFGLTFVENMAVYFPEVMTRWTFQAIGNGTFSVDSFFVLSGLLVAYLCLKELQKLGGVRHFNWGMYYFHRFWRLTPPYMLFLMFYVSLMKYWSNGPLWQQKGIDINECVDSWWRNLLYINNLFNDGKICMNWSWYLSNDMQFFILSPLMLIPLYYSSFLGGIVCLAFLLACFISAGVISSSNNLNANLMLDPNAQTAMTDIYFKPYTRIGPYVIGLLAGYILYKTQCKLRIPKVVNLVCWLAAAVVALAVLYGLYNPDDAMKSNLSIGVSALYNATSRTAWGITLAWVIVACATGNGGVVNRLLSLSIFVPLGRLTYCAYLVHPVVIYVYNMSRSTLVHFYDLEIIYLFLGNMCISYAAAFGVSLAFEAPMMGLEKVLLGRGKNS